MKKDAIHAILCVYYTFFMISSVSAQETTEGMLCNGYAGLCDKRYNEIAQINCHNATSNRPSLVQDQDRTIQELLKLGVRVFKIPIHYDYQNRIGYYHALLLEFQRLLIKEAALFRDEIEQTKNKTRLTLEEKQHEVNKLQSIINETEEEIRKKKAWFKSLPRFSFSGPSQTIRAIDYAAVLGALAIRLESLMLAKYTAIKVLKFAEKAGEFFVEQHPYFAGIAIKKQLIKEALKITEKHSEQEIFACHGLPKNELYGNHIGSLIDGAPNALKPVLKTILKPLEKLPNQLLNALYGDGSDRSGGGLFPYPACLIDTGAVPLADFLQEIKNFLDTNPHEVITILLNDFVENNHATAGVFQKAGVLPFTYEQDPTAPWPTLRALIESNKRLIVFTDSNHDTGTLYPWQNSRKFYTSPWNSNYNFSSSSSFTDPETPLKHFGDFSFRDTKPPQNKILEITHAVTKGAGGSKQEAQIINKKSVLEQHAGRIMKAADHIICWISLDFCTEPNNDAFDIINKINGVGAYEGKPLWQPTTSLPEFPSLVIQE